MFLILCCVFSCTVWALEEFELKVGSEFFVYGEDDEKLAEALDIPQDKIKEYCGKNVVYLAANKDNSKQIRITTGQNAFTYSVVNISNFTDDKITALIPQITEIEDITGEIINKNGQKFIKTQLRSNDSGGDYILTQFITVADKRSFVLSFYTDADKDDSYVEKIFETYNSIHFLNQNKQEKSILEYVLPALTIVFGVVSVIIGVSVIIDIRRKRIFDKETKELQEEEEERTQDQD